jgi:hypothetical protein
MPEEKKRWTIETWIQVAGLVAAVLAILVTVIFSLRSERAKEISVSVLAKRPLLSVDSANPRNGLEVRLKGALVAAPWLVSMRVENTGGLPIEERDIESPLRLFFQGGKPISSEVQTSSDGAISFNTFFSDDSVTVSHKLLNPGDWVGIDVLFEGEPKIPPTALARISGVNAPRLLLPKISDSEKTKFNLLGLPVPFLYGVLVLSTLFAAGLCIGGLALAYSSAKKMLFPTAIKSDSPARDEFLVATRFICPITDTGKVIFAAIGSVDGFELLEHDSRLIEALKEVPDGLLSSLGHDLETAAQVLRQELREGLKEAIAKRLYTLLPSGKDRQASERMRSLEVQKMSPFEIMDYGKLLIKEFGPGIDSFKDTGEWSDVIGGLTLLLFGAASIVVAVGGWRLISGQ